MAFPHQTRLLPPGCGSATPGARRAMVLAAATLAMTPAIAEGKDEKGKLSIHGTVSLGYASRTTAQDSGLLPHNDSITVGIPGRSPSPSTGRNQDDGNLNFMRHDPVAEVLRAYVFVNYDLGGYGFVASGKGWYDKVLSRDTHPYGHSANGYAPGTRLSDAGATSRAKFSNAVLDNLYAYGHRTVAGTGLDWKVGYQKLEWGHRYFVLGGLQDLNPLDVPGTLRPGALTAKDEENRVAIPAVFFRFGQPSHCIEAFYQVRFEGNTIPVAGTFYSQVDYLADGSDKVMFGTAANPTLSDRQAVQDGYYIKRSPNHDPSHWGQFGLAYRKRVDAIATEFGLYAAQFHSRSAAIASYKFNNPGGVAFIPHDPYGGNATYFIENPEKIRMFGVTFETKWRGGSLFGEATYRPNQPYSYNSVDFLVTALSTVAPTPLRAAVDALPPGGVFHAWERHRATQVQLGITQKVPNVLGARGLSCGAEFIYKGVPDLPDQRVTRFGRSDVFGEGPVNGVNLSTSPIQNSFDGFVTKSATAFRVFAGLLYANVAGSGVDLTPSVFYGKDLHGWSGDLTINQGRTIANVALKAEFAKSWWTQAIWQPTWGGVYNSMRDRGTAQLIMGYKF